MYANVNIQIYANVMVKYEWRDCKIANVNVQIYANVNVQIYANVKGHIFANINGQIYVQM